ncbi:hypothetical protein K502DRAFT_339770 [Neoconidiobolus thromboides FSU 785]|nr:hypothetical protein K502DRAFT_339770 [Neoconidiobolus thromboides FSU 785]
MKLINLFQRQILKRTRSIATNRISNQTSSSTTKTGLSGFEIQLLELSQLKEGGTESKPERQKPSDDNLNYLKSYYTTNTPPVNQDEREDIILSNIIRINSCIKQVDLLTLVQELNSSKELMNKKIIIEVIKKSTQFNNHYISYVLLEQFKRLGLLTYLQFIDDKVMMEIMDSIWQGTKDWYRVKWVLDLCERDGIMVTREMAKKLEEIKDYFDGLQMEEEVIDIDNVIKSVRIKD